MGEWWMQAKGTPLRDSDEFDNYMATEGVSSFVVVDFYMPACSWCEKFMPDWNRVVDDFKRSSDGLVKFTKVDGTQARNLAQRYEVQSFPTFIIILPGTDGMQFSKWKTRDRTAQGLADFINDQVDGIGGGVDTQ